MPVLTPKNILIIKFRAMGDSIIGHGGVSYMRSLYPDAHIIYAMPIWIAPLYKNVKTDADEIYGFHFREILDVISLWKFLKKKKIDLVYEMFQTGRMAKFFGIWSFITGNHYYAHNHHPGKSPDVHDQGIVKPIVQRDLDGMWSFLARETTVPNYLDFQPKLQIEAHEKNQIVFGVVATRQTKMWGIDNFIQLAKLIKQDYPQIKIIIPISKSEVDEEIKEKFSEVAELVQFIQEPLDKLPILLAGSKFYVGNDTGLKHLCASLGVKTFTLFGPEDPLEWHPYRPEDHPYFYKEDLECRTIKGPFCGLSTCDSMICLNEFTAEDVFSELYP